MDSVERVINNIDYKELLNFMLEERDYEDSVTIGPGNLLDNPTYKKNDDNIKISFDHVLARGIKGELWEQSESGRTFRHIALNRIFHEKNHLRLYMSPTNEYLYFIVNELLKRCSRSGEGIYLKYSRENRYDKVLLYINDPADMKSKLKLLDDIKKDNPEWFQKMSRASVWLSESPFPGAYMTPEKIVKRDYNVDYKSYTLGFISMIGNVRNEVLFHFKANDIKLLKNISEQELMTAFKYYLKRELGKMGLLLFYDSNGSLSAYSNDLFPGFGKSVDEDIILTDKGLEVGKREDLNHIRYYIIPFGSSLPMNPSEYSKFQSYVLDDKTAMMRRFYPDLYQPGSTSGAPRGSR